MNQRTYQCPFYSLMKQNHIYCCETTLSFSSSFVHTAFPKTNQLLLCMCILTGCIKRKKRFIFLLERCEIITQVASASLIETISIYAIAKHCLELQIYQTNPVGEYHILSTLHLFFIISPESSDLNYQ